MKVVIAGGGTGGHLYPGIALAETFKQFESESRILFVGTAQGMEARLIPEKGFSFAPISAQGFVGKGLIARMVSLWLVPIGLAQSIRILKGFAPHLVIGIGGYAAGPVLLAAVLLRMKKIILEPNLVPGLANKLMAPLVDLVAIAFEESRDFLWTQKIRLCGAPVRPEIIQAVPRPRSPYVKTVLILGGSQGAHAINRAMVEALPLLEKERGSLHVIHQTGNKDWEGVKRAYGQYGFSARVEPFIRDMAEVYAVADLVVSRAGAGTLSELAAIGKPSLLIPFPFAAGHQEKNAAAFVSTGAAEMILDRELDGIMLAKGIISLLFNPERLSKMGEAAKRRGYPHAAEEIVRACYELVGARGRPVR